MAKFMNFSGLMKSWRQIYKDHEKSCTDTVCHICGRREPDTRKRVASSGKFKVGDKIIAKKVDIEIWILSGKKYKVLEIIEVPSVPANPCYRNCGHKMHDFIPVRYTLVIDAETGKTAEISEDCFDLDN